MRCYWSIRTEDQDVGVVMELGCEFKVSIKTHEIRTPILIWSAKYMGCKDFKH